MQQRKLVSAEAILGYVQGRLWEIKNSSATFHYASSELADLIIRIENDLDEMLDDMCKESQERNRQIEIRLDDAFGDQDRFGDVIAGGRF
jgi:uncharacterized FlaG/YvyC family protein